MRVLFALLLSGAVLMLTSCQWWQRLRSPQRPTAPVSPGISVGQVAPDIAGEDVDGVRFRLSDHRGKVVALVFWATWCGPCKAMIPHERDLAARLRDSPFALLGVSADGDRGQLKQFLAAQQISWPVCCDGGADGPIARQWQVETWPTIYVLDGKGVVRFRDVRGVELEQAVETLLRELAGSN